MILENINSEIILIEDFDGKKWKINIQNTVIRPRASLELGGKIKIIGEILEENVFTAKEIRRWEGRGLRREK